MELLRVWLNSLETRARYSLPAAREVFNYLYKLRAVTYDSYPRGDEHRIVRKFELSHGSMDERLHWLWAATCDGIASRNGGVGEDRRPRAWQCPV